MAVEEKARLEDKQRINRRQRAAQEEEWSPLLFKLDIEPNTNTPHWVFNVQFFFIFFFKDLAFFYLPLSS